MFKILSNDAVLSRDSNLSPPRRRADALHVKPRSRVNYNHIKQIEVFIINIPGISVYNHDWYAGSGQVDHHLHSGGLNNKIDVLIG